MPDLSRLVDWVKLPPRMLFGLVLASGAVLYGPDWLLRPAGLVDLPAPVRTALGIVFIPSAALLLGHWIADVAAWAGGVLKAWNTLRGGFFCLRHLSPEEKTVLRLFMDTGGVLTCLLSPSNPVVLELTSMQIIYPASASIHTVIRADTVMRAEMREFNLAPWARRSLARHPERPK